MSKKRRSYRPRVVLRCAGDKLADKSRERIIEFFDPVSEQSGMISLFRRDNDESMNVSVFCVTSRVHVMHRRYRSTDRKGLP